MLNVALAGLGWWGKTVLKLLQHSRSLRPVLLIDPDAGAGRSVADAAGLPWAPSLDAALASGEVQAVILCTPHSQHAAQIEAAARAGKHVFCEKPLCLSRAEVERALAAVQAAGVTLAVGHERRFEAPVLELGALVAEGRLGTLLQVEANFSQDKFLALPPDNWGLSGKEAPAGPMTATGIHMLDLAVRFLGEAESVYASVRQLGSALTNGDTLALLVSFKSGAHALISAMLATPFVGRLAVYGSHGWAEIVDRNHPEDPQGWTMTVKLRGEAATHRDIAPMPAVLANLEAFGAAALGGAPYPVSHAQMRATVCALEAVFRSVQSGRVEPV